MASFKASFILKLRRGKYVNSFNYSRSLYAKSWVKPSNCKKKKLDKDVFEANLYQTTEKVKIQQLFQVTSHNLFNATPVASLRINKLKKIIDQWAKDPVDVVEGRQEAKQRIFEFFNSNLEVNTLLLSNLDLTSLPDIFHLEPFKSRLAQLDASYNKLIALPESFGKLQALTKLSLSHNQLTDLPESFIYLTALKYLSLSHNELTILPGLLGDLPALLQLDASYNYFLSNLPMEILNIPPTCIVYLIACNLSHEDLDRISKITIGPKIISTYEEKLTEIAKKKLKPMSLFMKFT